MLISYSSLVVLFSLLNFGQNQSSIFQKGIVLPYSDVLGVSPVNNN